MSSRRSLTELEGTVLGMVWARQPCTPYRVRREFLDSPSPYWSGSAGAIYPLMLRLESAGLLRSIERATGARVGRLYRVTPAGGRRLRRWVGPPYDAAVVGVPPDPLRVRVAFLSALPPARQRAALEAVRAGLRLQLATAVRSLEAGEAGGPYFELMARGAIAMLRTRLAWIASAARALGRSAARASEGKAPGPRARS